MDIIQVRDYLLTLPDVEETEPFADSNIIIYKICGKWFATFILERPGIIAVKCNPDRAVLLRDRFPAITPAWHFNKKHWNDMQVDALPDEIVKREICHSYLTVIRKNVSPKAKRDELIRQAAEMNIKDNVSPTDL